MADPIPTEDVIRLVHHVARRYYVPGMDYEDVVQEALTKVYAGLPKWRPDGATKASTWVCMAAEHSIWNLRRRVNTKKRIPLDSLVSFDAKHGDGEWSLGDLLPDKALGPDEAVEQNEAVHEVLAAAGETLSAFEFEVFEHLMSETPADAAEILGVELKTVEDAYAQVRAKLRAALGLAPLDVEPDTLHVLGDDAMVEVPEIEVLEEAFV